MLSGFEKALLAVLVLVLMTGMGATLTVTSFREVLRKPRGVLIGIASQFGWMPLIAFALASVLGLGVAQRRAVSLETGIQNSPLALAIIIASFDEAVQTPILMLPLLYALGVLISASVVTLVFRSRA